MSSATRGALTTASFPWEGRNGLDEGRLESFGLLSAGFRQRKSFTTEVMQTIRRNSNHTMSKTEPNSFQRPKRHSPAVTS